MAVREVMITTKDNPFDPLDQFDEWFAYDNYMGYGTCSYLARVAKINDSLPEETQDMETEEAIDEIILTDPFGFYEKVVHIDGKRVVKAS